MSNRQSTILNLLRTGPCSVNGLAAHLNAPTASVRRDIQALRRTWNITDARDNSGLYRLVTA